MISDQEFTEIIGRLARIENMLAQMGGAMPVLGRAQDEITPAELARLRNRHGKAVLVDFNAKQRSKR